MKNFLQALGAAALFCIAQSASALVITATLDSFESTPHTIAGVGTGGGRGTFSLVGSDVPVVGKLSSIIDASFQAVCLEPDSFITTGLTYNFLVTDLAFAPTTTGGMGAAREAVVETVLGRLGVTTVESLSVAGVGAVTALTYEAGYESAVNALDLTAGTAVVTGAGAPSAQVAVLGGPSLTDVDAFALINLGVAGGIGTRSVFEGQDFMVTVAESVGAPGVMALFGIGLMGLGFVQKSREQA